ncbi:hypothetical protein [Telluribacter sp.]|nr:hypothetical protein [Telluribacter sp.]
MYNTQNFTLVRSFSATLRQEQQGVLVQPAFLGLGSRKINELGTV